MKKYFVVLVLVSCGVLSQKKGSLKSNVTQTDTLALLTNNRLKYWDRIDTFTKYKVSDNINWCFYKNQTILEYSYENGNPKKREEYIYGGDVLYGKIPFEIISDTLKLLNHSNYLIKKLTSDTLITVEFVNGQIGKKAVYIKSKDQKQVPTPFEKK